MPSLILDNENNLVIFELAVRITTTLVFLEQFA